VSFTLPPDRGDLLGQVPHPRATSRRPASPASRPMGEAVLEVAPGEMLGEPARRKRCQRVMADETWTSGDRALPARKATLGAPM
jgi:hypothetical protein